MKTAFDTDYQIEDSNRFQAMRDSNDVTEKRYEGKTSLVVELRRDGRMLAYKENIYAGKRLVGEKYWFAETLLEQQRSEAARRWARGGTAKVFAHAI